MMQIKSDSFSIVASKTIAYISDQIEDQDKTGIIDVDYLGDILKLVTTKGEYVINKHSAAKEIWLASPISGPYHFHHYNDKWVNKHGAELFSLLEKELGQFVEVRF
jgi:iron donor protein CyaY